MSAVEPIELSEADYKHLRLQARRAIGRVSERIHYVLLFARGYAMGQIAQLYQVDERTVATWIQRFRDSGVEGLDDHPRSGRPRQLSLAARLEAERCLDTTPEALGLERTTWTRRLLRWHLCERLGCALSKSSVVRLIGLLGFVWGRPKLTLKESDPHAQARQEAIEQAIQAHPQAPRLYADECDIHQLPTIRGQYQRRGQQTEVPTPGNNKKQPVFGVLNVRSGQWHYFLSARKRSVEFIGCLHELYKLYPEGPILLFVDNASIHKSKMTLRWLAHHPRLLVYYLPAYSGHQTNPVEKVWWALKDEVCANYMYACVEALQDAIIGFFARFTPAAALRLTAQHKGKAAEPTSAVPDKALPVAA
jgi:transposase